MESEKGDPGIVSVFETTELNIKVLNPRDREYYVHTRFAYQDDSGFDVFCINDQIIPPRSFGNTISLGIQCEMIKDVSSSSVGFRKNIGFLLVPRSSISVTPLRMSNSVGIIDAGYRGEIKAKVDNWSDTEYRILRGEKFFQLVKGDLSNFRARLVDNLSSTERGERGFGSSNNI